MTISLKNLLSRVLKESDSSDDAHNLGLISAGWGRWKDPKTGQIVAKTIQGKLTRVEKPEDHMSDDEDKFFNNKMDSGPLDRGAIEKHLNDDPHLAAIHSRQMDKMRRDRYGNSAVDGEMRDQDLDNSIGGLRGKDEPDQSSEGFQERMDALEQLAGEHVEPAWAKSEDDFSRTDAAEVADKLHKLGDYEMGPRQAKLFSLLADKVLYGDHNNPMVGKGMLALAKSLENGDEWPVERTSKAPRPEPTEPENPNEEDYKHFGPDESVDLSAAMKRFRIK